MKKPQPVCFFLLVLILLAGCTSMINDIGYDSKNLELSDTSTIVCFGDSLTYGHGADSATESWPAVLQKSISIPVINAGRNDDTTLDGVQRFSSDVLAHNPAIVIFDFGGNDIFNFSKHQSYAEIEQNFRTMLDQMDFSRTQVYIMRFFNDDMRFFDPFGAFTRMLKRIQDEYDVVIIWDAWSNIWGHKDCKYDMTHCTAKGYAIMAQNILSVLEPCLRENNLLIKK